MDQPLADAIFWIAAVACVIAEVAILRSTYVTRGAERSSLVPASSRSGEIAWAIIPAIVLAALLGATWQKIQKRGQELDSMHRNHQMMPGMSMQTSSAKPVTHTPASNTTASATLQP
jgi:heme/copper-type cytochrome/quinol oxidase subunit 2